MNTKSFVNGLDPENTVKGYYDENDQLVMVEPEGSGGGDAPVSVSDVTFVNEYTGSHIVIPFEVPTLADGIIVYAPLTPGINKVLTPTNVNLTLGTDFAYTVSGAIVYDDNGMTINGPGTVTLVNA